MDHPTIMEIYHAVLSPITRVILVALLGVSVSLNFLLWTERTKAVKKFGEKTWEWIIK